MDYKFVRDTLRNGDICEFKTWDNKITFGFYMDGHIYKNQSNDVVCGLGGVEEQIIAIRRPQSMRNAFDCFKNGDLYNYSYRKYGSFETIFEE